MSSFVVLEVSEASDAGFSPLFKRSSRNAFLGCGGFSLGCSGSRHWVSVPSLPSSAHLSEATEQLAGSAPRLWKRWTLDMQVLWTLSWHGQSIPSGSPNESMTSLSEEKQQMGGGVGFGGAVEREPFRQKEQNAGEAQRQQVSWHNWGIKQRQPLLPPFKPSPCWRLLLLSLRFEDGLAFPHTFWTWLFESSRMFLTPFGTPCLP